MSPTAPAGLPPTGEIVAAALADRVGPRVLDCGGGSGRLAVPLAVTGAHVTVVDTSIDALATLTRRAAEAGVADRVDGRQGELEALDAVVPAGSFDAVLLHDVLGVVADPAALLRQAGVAVAPGGLISVVVANPVAAVLSRAATPAAAAAELDRLEAGGLDLDAVLGLLAAAGLTPERVIGLGALSQWADSRPAALELDRRVAERAPFRDIAPVLQILTRTGDRGT